MTFSSTSSSWSNKSTREINIGNLMREFVQHGAMLSYWYLHITLYYIVCIDSDREIVFASMVEIIFWKPNAACIDKPTTNRHGLQNTSEFHILIYCFVCTYLYVCLHACTTTSFVSLTSLYQYVSMFCCFYTHTLQYYSFVSMDGICRFCFDG